MPDRCIICGEPVHETLLTCNSAKCKAKAMTKPDHVICAIRRDRVLAAFRKAPPGGRPYIHLNPREPVNEDA